MSKAFHCIETGVVKGYKTVERSVVGTYNRIENHFVDRFLRKDGESIEEAKVRLSTAAENNAIDFKR